MLGLLGTAKGIASAALQAAATTASSAPVARPLLLTVAEAAAAVAAIFLFGILFTRVFRRVATKAGASKSVSRAVDQWLLLTMVVAAVAAVAGVTGLSSELSTLTISGIGGLAVTLALQNTLSNIIAGVLMFRDGVLRLGDDVEFGPVRGAVVKLSLRTTWVKRGDGSITVIGNSNLASGPIVNYTAKARLEKKLQL
ncbi:MAG: mechanosensitive ion channel [Thaumarchaeota archaeon]|nr:mechanosensitive ion channel [Nitrososphaerota archaeon]